jgi:sugar-specific transcriptional regulator TrmB
MTTPASKKPETLPSPEQIKREVIRTMYQLQNQLREAEDEYLRLTRKRRDCVRQAAKLVPVTELAKALRISRQKVYQIMNQE